MLMDRLLPNQRLEIEEELRSNNGWFAFRLGNDGACGIYRVQTRGTVWTPGVVAGPRAVLVMQTDGNLVLYAADGQSHWATNTDGNPGASVAMQDDGNMVVYGPGGNALWASNTVQDLLSPVIRMSDGRYSYVETSESWKQLCSVFPCFLALQWPGYATTIVETQLNGQDVVLQLWKGYCPKFLGHASFPGGVGAEVGVYRRIPGKFRPTSMPFLPGPLASMITTALSTLNDNDLWWPAPEINASLEMRLVNPVTGETFLSAGPEDGYWLTRWMNEFDYARYVFDHQAPPIWDFTAYVLEYSVNGQPFEPWSNQGPTRQNHGSARHEVNAVTRSPDHLDVFMTDFNSVTRTAAWEPAFTDGWHGWWELNGGRAMPGAPVTVVSRSKDKLDVFFTGNDHGIYTAAWEPGFTDGWHGWWRIGDIALPAGSRISAVSRTTDKIDIFATDVNGVVRTAAWEEAFTDGWHGWWELNSGRAAPGATVTAVSRSRDKLDVFTIGLDGGIYTAAWEPAFTDGWHGWWRIGNLTAPPGAAVHAVSRSTDKLDIFVADSTGVIRTAAWEPAFTDGWHGWWELNGGRAMPGAPVTVVSRSRDKLDVFVTGNDHGIYTAAWEPGFTDGWHGWWRIGP